jgi:hypothetical protein
MRKLSIGDIGKTKYWLSFEQRPISWRWHLSFGPTYNGTIAGVCCIVPGLSILGHIRKLAKKWIFVL